LMAADDPVNEMFAANLTRLRTARGLTKGALAALSGVDQTGIGKIEAGANGTTLATAGLLAEALGTTVAEMLAPDSAETRKMRDIVCKLLDLYGAPDDRLMQHSSITRATLQRYAAEAGVRLDGLPT